MIKTAVVILNWNGISFLKKFLSKVVEDSSNNETAVYVIDNNSTDESIPYIKDNHPQVKLIELEQNFGFAGGYNKGLAQIKAKYYILLNSDIETTPNWVTPLIARMDEDSSIAASMPKLKAYNQKTHFEYAGAAGGFIDKYGYPFCQGRLFQEIEEDCGQYNTEKDIMWATGAALCIRSDVYNKMEGLDSDFFAHMEEIDLCWRIKNHGYRIIYNPNSEVFHVGGGTLQKENPFKTYLNFRNNLFLLYKNLQKKELSNILFKRRLLDGIAFAMFIVKFDFKNCKAVWKAHIDFYKMKPSFVAKRKSLLASRNTETHKEIYPRSIVFDHFIHGKKKIKL